MDKNFISDFDDGPFGCSLSLGFVCLWGWFLMHRCLWKHDAIFAQKKKTVWDFRKDGLCLNASFSTYSLPTFQ